MAAGKRSKKGKFLAKGYGGTVLEKVRTRLEAGWPCGVTLLTGKDLYHLDAVQEALLEGLLPEETSDFALSVFGEEKVEPATLVVAARSVGMFAAQRVILVRELSALEGKADPLVEYAANPPAGSYLIIRAPDLDKRRKLHKALATAAHCIECSAPSRADESRFRADVKKKAAERKLTLPQEVGLFLTQTSEGNLYQVIRELDKIRDYYGGDGPQTVRLEDARQVLTGTEILDSWEVANALLNRDEPAAILATRKLLRSGGNAVQLLGGIAYRARTMIQARAMLENGRSRREIVTATRSWYIKDSLFQGLNRYSFGELLAIPGELIQADRALKSSSVDPCLILENVLHRILAGGAESKTA